LNDETIGVVAPLVLNGDGGVEDSARRFPNPIAILSKVIGFKFQNPYVLNGSKMYPDWVAGMFMLFRADTFREINGFDDKYFLYYEDVDICARLTNENKHVVLCSNSKVIHLAQRASHRNLKYLSWHIASMVRFFLSMSYWRLLWR
jgi:GT2 family glycosyltransferase